MQLVTGKSVTLPGLVYSSPATTGGFDADNIKSIIMGHYEMIRNYTEAEFTKKLLQVSTLRREKYQDLKYKPGDKVYY